MPPFSATTVFPPVSVTVTPAVSLSLIVIATLSAVPATTPEGSAPNSSTSVSASSSMSSSTAVKVSVPLLVPLVIATLPLLESVKSAADAVGLPLVRIRTGMDRFASAFLLSVTVTVSVPPSVTVPLAETLSSAVAPSTVKTGDRPYMGRVCVLASALACQRLPLLSTAPRETVLAPSGWSHASQALPEPVHGCCAWPGLSGLFCVPSSLRGSARSKPLLMPGVLVQLRSHKSA